MRVLEARIIPERIEHWIEPEQCESERRNLSEKFSVYCFGASEATIFSKRGSPRSASKSGSRRELELMEFLRRRAEVAKMVNGRAGWREGERRKRFLEHFVE